MTINYRPRGGCSQQMQIEVEDGVIRSFPVSYTHLVPAT